MNRYATLFDRGYLDRGLALHRSLIRHSRAFSLHVLCLDEATFRVLSELRLPGVEPLPLDALLRWDPELAAAKGNRGTVEFYFTCKASLLLYLYERGGGRISYLDSDLWFLADDALVERACAGSPIALSPHRLPPRNAHWARFGRFNAGWLSVDASPAARRFLDWWRARCLESCTLVVDEKRFGDQKYLDQVPALFPGSRVLEHPGIDAGPWNLDPAHVEVRAGRVHVAGSPLVLFHFHGLRPLAGRFFESGLREFGVELSGSIRNAIYRPYVDELWDCERQVRTQLGERERTATVRTSVRMLRSFVRGSIVRAAG